MRSVVVVVFLLPGLSRAQDVCATCHPSEVAAFERSPMGRSVSRPTISSPGHVIDKIASSSITIEHRGDTFAHKLEHRGVVAEYPVAYSVGAGVVGYSYMVWVGHHLFQSPASYYTQTKRWDLTPGYETDRHIDFTHEISGGCLFCHTGSVNRIAGASNQFAEPPFTAISCERCHGPTAAHLKNPIRGSIVNPAKLASANRDSVCEQCHLEGDARVLNPGRDWWDFEAGQATESVFATYLRTTAGSLRAVSQSELLAQSRCARESGGRLWCGTCHDPHGSAANRSQEIRGICLSCHADLFQAKRHEAAADCVTCHMPRLRPTNVAHSAITDHSIPRKPPSSRAPESSKPIAWRDPGAVVARRSLGIAYFDLATSSHAASDVRSAYEILSHLPAEQMKDPVVVADLGSILLANSETRAAVEMFTKATAREPSNARYAYCLATALAREGKTAAAIQELRRSIDLDPSQVDAYIELSKLYEKAGEETEARRVLSEYLRFMPQNIELRSTE